MIRESGGETFSTSSQTLNWWESNFCNLKLDANTFVSSGPFLVSRTGDAGWTERWDKVPNFTQKDTTKDVYSSWQQDSGHGSRNLLRSVLLLTCRMNKFWKWMALKRANLYSTLWISRIVVYICALVNSKSQINTDIHKCKVAWWLRRRLHVNVVGAIISADLGGSSNYSKEVN